MEATSLLNVTACCGSRGTDCARAIQHIARQPTPARATVETGLRVSVLLTGAIGGCVRNIHEEMTRSEESIASGRRSSSAASANRCGKKISTGRSSMRCSAGAARSANRGRRATAVCFPSQPSRSASATARSRVRTDRCKASRSAPWDKKYKPLNCHRTGMPFSRMSGWETVFLSNRPVELALFRNNPNGWNSHQPRALPLISRQSAWLVSTASLGARRAPRPLCGRDNQYRVRVWGRITG